MAAPSSAAQERLGKTRNNATAIIAIRITSFVIFMIAFPFRTLPSRRFVDVKQENLADDVRAWNKNVLIVMQFLRKLGGWSVIVVTPSRDCGRSLSASGA